MFYDLHIHSCLSPCASDDMTPNNIVNMALLKGLDVISVTDHNSTLQQRAIQKVAKRNGLGYVFGVEVQTIEDVHCLCYFKNEVQLDQFQKYLDEHLIKVNNKKEFFGNQILMNEYDEKVGEVNELLLSSLNVSIDELSKVVQHMQGVFIPAHIDGRKNSILFHLSFIPEDLHYDGLEIKGDLNKYKDEYPNCPFFMQNSDAHQLVDIHEAINEIPKEMFEGLFL